MAMKDKLALVWVAALGVAALLSVNTVTMRDAEMQEPGGHG